MDGAVTEARFLIGMAVVVRVAQHEHAAHLTSLIEQSGDHVAILPHDEVPHRAHALGEYRGAKPRRKLDRRIAARHCARLVLAAGERGRGGQCESERQRPA